MSAQRPSSKNCFTRLAVLSVLVTLGIYLAMVLYCRVVPGKSLFLTSRHVMMYIGLVHFAVGYHFFFTSSALPQQLSTGRFQFFAKLGLCAGLGILCYPLYPSSEVIAFALFYLHAAENSAFQIFKMSEADRSSSRGSIPSASLWPLIALLILARVFSPQDLAYLNWPIGFIRLGVMMSCLVLLAWLLPQTDWNQGWRLARRYWVLVASFVGIALFFREGRVAFDLFIIWHCVIWFGYTWMQRPSARLKLVESHLFFAVLYKGVWLLDDASQALSMAGSGPLIPWLFPYLLISRAAFTAQSTAHILLSFVFRTYQVPASAPGASA